MNTCLAEEECDAAILADEQRSAAATAASAIAQACPTLADMIAVNPIEYIERAASQIDCTAATAHADTAALELGCGPSNVESVPSRGEWTEIVLNGNKWGTMCGDGSDSTDNPFANWTQIYLPYCNQDVFMGGGVVETLGDLDLPRYGAVNMRAGVQVLRDILWKQMDEAGGEGFRRGAPSPFGRPTALKGIALWAQ